MGGLNSGLASGHEELLNSGVAKALDHVLSVAPHARAVKRLCSGFGWARQQLTQTGFATGVVEVCGGGGAAGFALIARVGGGGEGLRGGVRV